VQHLAVNGGDLEYRVVGRGEPVLLIHGSIVADAFKPMLSEPALSGYQLITYHRRGFAGSSRARPPFSIPNQAADALALLDHLGVSRAHVVGHSYGGDIALQLAADHPDRVASLVLLEPALFPMTPSLQAMGGDIMSAVELHTKGNDRAAIDRFMSTVVGSSAIDQYLGPGAFDLAVTDAPTFFDVEAPAMQTWKFAIDDASAIRIPTLLIVGAESRQPFKESVAALHQQIAGSEQVTIPRSAHSLEIAYPRPVAEAIAGFLRRHPIR
jgi:pimeloyl-ACP methyl ester carboxylesterase